MKTPIYTQDTMVTTACDAEPGGRRGGLAPHQTPRTLPPTKGLVTARHRARVGTLLLFALLTLLPIACNPRSLGVLPGEVEGTHHDVSAQQCANVDDPRCVAGGGHGPSEPTPRPVAPPPPPPPCDDLCVRLLRTYRDPRTRALLALLAQTPTGRGAADYLLYMGAKLGDGFISWHDFGGGLAGANNAGGFIQLNSRLWAKQAHAPYFLAGTLVHEAVESYFDVGEGIRDMGTRHADYVAEWWYGKFERELHAIPYYHTQDPFYSPDSDSSYGLSYSAWLFGTEDGQLYWSERADCDLRAVDRKGRAWPPTDWWAEQGGFWLIGQGIDVAPVRSSMGLSLAMLSADDLGTLETTPRGADPAPARLH